MPKQTCVSIRIKNLRLKDQFQSEDPNEDKERIKKFFKNHVKKAALQCIIDNTGYPENDKPLLKVYNKRFDTYICALEPKRGKGIDIAFHFRNLKYSYNVKNERGSLERLPFGTSDLIGFFGNVVFDKIVEVLSDASNLTRPKMGFMNKEYKSVISDYFIIV